MKFIKTEYDLGYKDGESSHEADLNILLETLEIPFNTDDMSEFDVVRELSKRLNESIKVLDSVDLSTI